MRLVSVLAAAVALGTGVCPAAEAVGDSAAPSPPLVNTDCLGQGAMLTVLESGRVHTGRYVCPDRGAVLLDASRIAQGAWVVVGGRRNVAAQDFG